AGGGRRIAAGRARKSCGRKSCHVSAAAGTPPTFTVGLIQMRSGLDPAANLDAASKLIAEAKAAGADYVQTPEMTNVMEIRRGRLFAAIVAEEADPSLAAFRELARKHAIHIHL